MPQVNFEHQTYRAEVVDSGGLQAELYDRFTI